MIKSIKIKNVQSHKNSELQFVSGINAIVGSSNNGKSAILRALNWVRYNRPLGLDILLSHWAYDSKGNQKEPMSVILETDNGTVERRRTKDKNQYIVDGQVLNVVKTDVPEQVENLLRLSETNIQSQQDSPFLLSQSSGEVAKYFNRTVRLDVIDIVLSKAGSEIRNCKKETELLEKQLKQEEGKLEQFDWIPECEKLICKYEKVQNKTNLLQSEIEKLELQILEYETRKKEQIDFTREKQLIEEYEKELKLNIKLEGQFFPFEKQFNNYSNICKSLYPDFTREKKLIKEIEKINSECEEQSKQINHIGVTIKNHDYYLECIENNDSEISELKQKLPKICPLCGNPMKNGECENENDN